MIKDRLKELKANSHSKDYEENVVVFRDDLAQDVHSFLQEVEAIHDLLNNIRVNTSEIKTLFGIILGMPGAHEKRNAEVAERQSIVNNTIRNVKSKLLRLEMSIEAKKQTGETLHRIQFIQFNALHSLLAKFTEEYLKTLVSHKERCDAIMKRQVAISNREDELEDLLEKGASVFVDNIISDTLEAQLQLNMISQRHHDLKRIEASIEEMRDMFVELALQVESQGEKMNCIRYLIEKSELYTDRTTEKLEKAQKRAKRARKRRRKVKFVLALIVVILCFVLLIIIST